MKAAGGCFRPFHHGAYVSATSLQRPLTTTDDSGYLLLLQHMDASALQVSRTMNASLYVFRKNWARFSCSSYDL